MTGKNSVPIVEFSHVTMRYVEGSDVFRQVSFGIEPRSFNFLTGPSGVGKSTLLKLIHLSEVPFTGTVRLFGRDTYDIARWELPLFRSRVSFVFQDFRLVDHINILDNVALALYVRGVDVHECRHRAAELLSWVGLEDSYYYFPPMLSGGEQQRVAIARAIISRPQLLLADEPTGNVDDENAAKIIHLFQELNKRGTTVILATHNFELTKKYAYRELYLTRDGIVSRSASDVDHSEGNQTAPSAPDIATPSASSERDVAPSQKGSS